MKNYESHTLRPQKNEKRRGTLSAFLDRFYQGAWITWYLKVWDKEKVQTTTSSTTTTKRIFPFVKRYKSSFIHEAFCFFLAYAISRSISYSAGLGSPKSSFPWNALGQEWKLMTTKRGGITSPCHHMSKHQKLPENQRCGQFPSSETSSSWG